MVGFSYVKENNHNSLDDFSMEIIEEISFFFFDLEEPTCRQSANQAMRRNDAEIDKQGACIAKKKRVKSS